MKIILYSNHCPRCRLLEQRLKSANIEYDEVNNVDEMIKLGMTTVPMLGVDGEIMNFGKAIAWINER